MKVTTLTNAPGRHAIWLILILLVHLPESDAKERVQRRFDEHSGLVVSSIQRLAQDESGFIWIGTVGGLVRYDGVEMRPWAKDTLSRAIDVLVSGPAGEVLVAHRGEKLYRLTSDGVEPLPGPDGTELSDVRDATFDSAGSLWILNADSLLCRVDGTKWLSVVTPELAGEWLHAVRPGRDKTVFLLTNTAVWQLSLAAKARRVFESRVVDIVQDKDGALYFIARGADRDSRNVIELRDGRAIVRLALKANGGGLAVRGQVVWASFDRYLVAIRSGETPEVLGPEDGIPSGGSLLVDREGSLWMGTFRGLIQFPEPETVALSDLDGLPSAHARYLYSSDEGIWISTWQGLGRVEKQQGRWRPRNELASHLGRICGDSLGEFWVNGLRDELWRRSAGRFVKHSRPIVGAISGCAHSGDGAVWLATAKGLFSTSRGAKPVRVDFSVPGEADPRLYLGQVLEDKQGRLWVTRDERVCHARAVDVTSGHQISWQCQTVQGARDITSLIQLPSGSIWMATNSAGVWRYESGEWRPIPASRSLGSRTVLGLVLSPSGGVWVLGHGANIRVIERRDLDDGWEVVEHLTAWHGFPAGEAQDLIEESDGALWITTAAGVVRVPREARRSKPEPPRVELIDLLINGRRTALDHAPDVPPAENQVELRFAALSYRDRNLLRYQYRLQTNSPWTDSSTALPHFRFVNLGSGYYAAEVRASLDGVYWTAVPGRLAFKVLTPWYLQWWIIVLFGIAIAAALYTVYRVRLSFLVRLERQRTRIAMDLHDEIGSGLGSIGLLSHVMSEDTLNDVKRKDLAQEIAQTSGELGSALTDIVWALGSGSITLEGLAYHLTEHASRLFPTNHPIFSTDFPTRWPAIHLSLAIRRNLQLIALEGLHNAARHAKARKVVLAIKPFGRKWRLSIADDGLGMEKPVDLEGQTGMGIKNIKRRAEEIGAQVSWSAENGRGTTLLVTFDPQAEDRRFKQPRPSR